MIRDTMTNLLDESQRIAFGQRLRNLRKTRGLTLKEVAAPLGVQHTHLNRYEAGAYLPPMDKLIVLAKLFGVTLDFLVLGEESDSTEVQNKYLLERFKALDQFPREDQEAVVKLIDAMIFQKRVQGAAEPLPL